MTLAPFVWPLEAELLPPLPVLPVLPPPPLELSLPHAATTPLHASTTQTATVFKPLDTALPSVRFPRSIDATWVRCFAPVGATGRPSCGARRAVAEGARPGFARP